MSSRTIVRPEEGEGKRLAVFLSAEDALEVYKLMNGPWVHDGRFERLCHLFEEHYEEATGERLTEPWEWDDE